MMSLKNGIWIHFLKKNFNWNRLIFNIMSEKFHRCEIKKLTSRKKQGEI